MKIQYGFAVVGLLIATLVGIFSQDISYFLHERFQGIGLTTAITVLTFLSIGLFIIIPAALFISKKTRTTSSKIYLLVSGFLGIPISIWSFFVWAMWMG